MTLKTLEPAPDLVLRREQLAEAIAGDRPGHGLLSAVDVMGREPTG